MHRFAALSVISLVVLTPIGVFAAEPGTKAESIPADCAKLFNIPADSIKGNSANVITAEACEAKKFLMTRYQPGGCSAKNGSKEAGIANLDTEFAVNLAKMLKRAPMTINIISAYRSPTAQSCANPKVTNSNHTKGCAVDLQYSQNDCGSATCQWVIKNAGTDKMQIRMRYAPEWNHLEPLTCKGNGLGSAVSRDASNASNNAAPLAGIANALRNYMNPQQPQQQAPQQALSSAQNPLTYVPPQTSSNINTSSNVNTNTATSAAVIDLIGALGGNTGTSAATGTTIGFNGTTTVSLNAQQTGNASGSAFTLLPAGQQTFTSEDLRYSQPVQTNSSGAWQILENMKQSLIRAIAFLKPFGGSVQSVDLAHSSASVAPGSAYAE